MAAGDQVNRLFVSPQCVVLAPMKAICADITTLDVDAIVNAANSSLLGGGGVDGAIHRAAGSELVAECRTLNGCKTGEAKLTGGYRLPCRFVIHTVGPVWNQGGDDKKWLLASCYEQCLTIAHQHDEIASIAFPCISTGIYSFPADLAAEIAVSTCRGFVGSDQLDITFCCFSEQDLEYYEGLLCG